MPTTLQVTASPLIPQGTKTPSRLTAPAKLRSAKLPYSEDLARDLENMSQSVNNINTVLANNVPSISRMLLTDSQSGAVVAAFGDFSYQGKYYTNFLNELHVCDPLGQNNPNNAVFNANPDGSVTIGENGWLDVLDPYGNVAAWLGAQNDTLAVTGAANNGSGLIRLTVPGHTLATGNQVRVQGVGGVGQISPTNSGAFVNNATGVWTVTVINSSTIDLQGSAFAGAYTSGGAVDRVLQITGAANNGSGLIRIATAVAHTYTTGDEVNISSVGGVGNSQGQWTITVIDSTHFDLANSTFAGTYTSGGTCLRYFAGVLAQSIAIGSSFSNSSLRAYPNGSLFINNATITLSSSTGQILLNPAVPEIALTTTANPAKIHLDANPPSLTLFDQSGNAVTVMQVVSESALSVTATSNASPDVLTVPGHTYVNGDTVYIAGAAGDTAINGYYIVESASGSTFQLTTLAGAPVAGNGAYTGGGTCARYYAGLLAQTLAIGSSFANYKLRAFADGTLIISGAKITDSTVSATGSGNLTETVSAILTIVGGTNALFGTGTTIQVAKASASVSGYLSSADWTTFNNKQAALTLGNLTEATSSVLTITGGTGATVGNATVQVKQAGSSQAGYLSSTDWTTFNNKQAALGFTPLNPANNLSELASASTARTNLGLGSAATQSSSAFDAAGAATAAVAAIPNASGTTTGLLKSSDWTTFNNKAGSYAAVSHQWVNAISSSGVVSSTQPAFSDISGAATTAQLPTSVAAAVTNDTNVTGSITSQNLTLAWSGQLSIARGGTGQNTAAAAFNALSPLTTLGDLLYASGANTAARLAGNTTAAKQFLTQTGTGTVSAAPAWGTIAAADLPGSITSNTSGNAATATTATTATNLAGGAVGSFLYQSAAATTAMLSGNTTAADQVVVSHGTGSAAQAPTLSNAPALSAANMTSFPTLNQNTTGTAANVTGIVAIANGGTGAATAAAALTALGAASLSTANSFGGTQEISISGFTTIFDANSIQFNRAGNSYVEQSGVAGSIVFRLTASTQFDTTALSLTTTGISQALKTTSYNGIATVQNGIPAEYASASPSGQTANIGATTLYAVPAAPAFGYRITVAIVETTVATSSSTLPSVQVVYTDASTSGTVTITLTATSTANAAGTYATGHCVVDAKASTNIQYQTTGYLSSGATAMAYKVKLILEAL